MKGERSCTGKKYFYCHLMYKISNNKKENILRFLAQIEMDKPISNLLRQLLKIQMAFYSEDNCFRPGGWGVCPWGQMLVKCGLCGDY